MKKKILSVVLALTMVFGMSMASFATTLNGASGAATGSEITATSTTTLPVIKITVPTNPTIVVNPFQLTVGEGAAARTDQILAPVQEIKSESNVPVAVNVASFKATVPESSTITIAKSSAAKATTKSAYITLKIGKDLDTTDAAEIKQIKTVVATTAGAALANAYVLDAAEFEDGAAKAPVVCEVQIGGDVNPNPVIVNSDKTTTADPWTNDAVDKITVSVKFTFTPQIVTE
jgi:hypothetical protein